MIREARFEKVYNFLERQKRRLLLQDGATEETSWLTPAEQKGYHYVAEDQRTGRKIGMMEMLYDNAIAWLSHASRKGLRQEWLELSQSSLITEDTTSASDIATFTTSLLPAIRRMFATNVGFDLVSVQPLSSPTGILYWIDYKYTEAHAGEGISAGDKLADHQGAKTAFDSSEKGTIYQIDAELKSKTISTEIKKVATRWTLEAEQDFSSQWKLNLESELMPELSNAAIREVNRKIIAAMYAAAKNNVNWSKSVPAGDTTSADKQAYYQTLWHAIQLANSKIVGEKYRPATFLLMNHNTYYYLERLENFKASPNVGETAMTHIQYVGTLSGLYKVYVDPHFDDDVILLSYRGASWKDSVAYYCPYIPLFLSDRYIYNNDFTQIMRGAMTRYAYGVIPESSTQSPVQNGGIATVTLVSS